MEIRIEVDNADFSYNRNNIVFENISFTIEAKREKGLVCSIVGQSGSGKSTLLKIIAGIYHFNRGECNIYPENLVVSYLPQSPIIFEHMSPLDNAQYFKYTREWRTRFNEGIFQRMLQTLDLENIINKSNSILELSGGEKQRLMLLRSLSINPDILLLDEPLTGIDSDLKHFFLLNLRRIAEEQNLLIINVTHHSTESNLISDRVLYLAQSKNDNIVRDVEIYSHHDFINNPPDINAAFFNYFPKVNSIPIFIDNNKVLLNNGDNNFAKNILILPCNAFSFSNKDGFDYKIIGANGENIFLEIATINKLLIMENSYIQKQDTKICINGDGLLYDESNRFIKKIKISNNIII